MSVSSTRCVWNHRWPLVYATRPSRWIEEGCNEMRRCDGCIFASWCIYDESFLCKWLINQHHPTPKWKWLWVKPLQCLNVKNKLTLSWCRWLVIEDQQLDSMYTFISLFSVCVCAIEVRNLLIELRTYELIKI